MRKSLAVSLSFASLFAASAAEARYVWYSGAKADAFIAKYLPGASIPGPINQAFTYGYHRHGWASCMVPAMGGRSDGEVSQCYVKF
jgi:hypothetical protein